MKDSPFKIYNASAGSGKTYTLVKEYLKIILSSPKSYKQILAITFTNKAVNEMKHRILGSLFDFGQTTNLNEPSEMFRAISKELGVDSNTLQKKSKATLKDILHNYAFFDISTIDKFTHRLIRTFAKDLKLPQNFEVILDNEMLLSEAVTRLIDKAGRDEQLTKILIDFALEKIDDNKSWDIAFDLNAIGKLLFNENHTLHLQKLIDKDISAFLALKKIIIEKTTSLKREITASAKEALSLIEFNGLLFNDFTASYFPKFMLKISGGDLNIDFNAGWKNNFETNALYSKSCLEGTKATLDALQPQLVVLFNAIKNNLYDYLFLKNAYANIVPLTVLNTIQQEVKALLKERDQLSISEFNTIISNEIKHQPAPFIYERLGEKYRYYFVDEFQDTSVMQWHNLIPLIANALASEEGSLFLVGDVKQAIYRWRGGKAEQFLNLVNRATNPFVVAPEIELLPKNYRSYTEIIKFNNDFFTITSPLLHNDIYRALFEEGNKQDHNDKEGGLVEITVLNKDIDKDMSESYCDEVLNTIKSILDKNYRLQDITILVRDNKHGIVLADFLTQHNIPVISPDSLLITSSSEVRFLIHLLLFCSQPEDIGTSYKVLSFLADKEEHTHQFIQKHLTSLDKLLKETYAFDIQLLNEASVYDGLEYAIKQFQLAKNSDAHILYLMDTVFEVEQKEGTGVQTFLSYWEKKKDKLSITAPENVDAVQIMSIHKAKGLEFNIVIFPFANSNIYKEIHPKLWLKVAKESFNGFEEVLISKKQEVVNYNSKAAAIYDEEQHKLELDAFNVLYVALTRAIKALYIISEKDLNKAGKHNTNYYSGLFIQYLKEKGIWDEHRTTYSFGHLDDSRQEAIVNVQENINYRYSFKEKPSFKILAKSGMLWDTERGNAISKGNLIHTIMGLVETEKDVQNALGTLQRNGDITADETNYIKKTVNQILNHPKLHPYYKEGNIIINERDIITDEGKVLRPDRVVLRNDKATLIDYKSGKKNPAHYPQLYAYADALETMGYEVDEKIIIYIDDTITLEFI